ncbi:MAG: BadF/BadG/BcrA/BcrD ATPase family protein [Erysipelotrichaceae bacterium]
MKYYLGVDGGGTKTKFLLCDSTGKTLAESTQPTCHYLQCGLEGVTKVMKDGLTECVKISNVEISKIFVSCAGYGDIENDNLKIKNAVSMAFPDITFRVGNDTENALAGALAGKIGINIIAGTGSIALGIDSTGKTYRSGGWHHIFGGDEGSAYWIACHLILEFTRQSDGRDEKTFLYHYLKEKLNIKDDSDILQICVNDWNFDRTKVAALAALAYQMAKNNDPHAIRIYKAAAKELSEIILAVKQNLIYNKTVLVSYTGGVFKSEKFILNPLKNYLKNNSIKIVEPLLQPDQGSVILAMQMDNLKIDDKIIHNLQLNNG